MILEELTSLGASFSRELGFDKEMFGRGEWVFELKSDDSTDFDGGNRWEFKRLRALKIKGKGANIPLMFDLSADKLLMFLGVQIHS